MAIMDRIKSAAQALFGSGSVQAELVSGRHQLGRKSKRAQIRAQKEVPPFFRVLSKISWDFAATEWDISDLDSGEELPEEDPLILSLKDPNPELSRLEVKSIIMQYYDAVGEAVVPMFPKEGENGEPLISLWPVPPTAAERSNDGDEWHIDHNNARFTFPKEAVLHIKRPDLTDPYGRGYGYGGVLSDELQTVEKSSEFVKNTFANSARPDVIVNLAKGDKKKAQRFKQTWTRKFAGPKNANKPMIHAGSGPLSVETLTPAIKDTKVQELKKMSADEVRETFGVPPSIMGRVENSNQTSIRFEQQIYANNVQKPRLTVWKHVVEQDLAPLWGKQVKAEHEDVGPDQKEFKLQTFKEAPDKTFTRNEWRDLGGEKPREDGDRYLGPGEPKLTETPAAEIVSDEETKAIDCCNHQTKVYELPIEKQVEDVPPEARAIAEQLQADQIRTEITEEYEGQLEVAIAEQADLFDLDKDEMFTILNPFTQEHVENFSSERIVGINDTTRDQIQRVLGQAIKEGKNPRDIADDVGRYVEDIIPNRGETIARTEMMRSRNAAGFQTQKASGIFNEREWIATLDGRVRATHLGLNANRKGYKEPFKIAGVEAMHPGDFGVPEEDINCRCTTMPAPNELFRRSARFGIDKAQNSDELRETYWKSFDKSLQQQEREFERVVTSALTRQIKNHILPRVRDLG